jgi:hypothetical protein
MGFFRRYRETLRHEHGWEVELTCPQCGHTGLPRYEGWKPNLAGGFGKTPTIFANLACTKCGRDLRRAAGEQLVATFSRIAVPKGNKRLLVWFVIAVLLIVSLPIVAQFTLRPGFHVASFGVILVLPLIIAVNYRVDEKALSLRRARIRLYGDARPDVLLSLLDLWKAAPVTRLRGPDQGRERRVSGCQDPGEGGRPVLSQRTAAPVRRWMSVTSRQNKSARIPDSARAQCPGWLFDTAIRRPDTG